MSKLKKAPRVPRETMLDPGQIHNDLWDRYFMGLFNEDLAEARLGGPYRAAKDLAAVRDIRDLLTQLAKFGGPSLHARERAQAKQIEKARAAAEANRQEIARLETLQTQLDAAASAAADERSESVELEQKVCCRVWQNRHLGVLLREEMAAVGLSVCPKLGYPLDQNGKPHQWGPRSTIGKQRSVEPVSLPPAAIEETENQAPESWFSQTDKLRKDAEPDDWA